MRSSNYILLDTKELLNHRVLGSETLGDSLILNDNLNFLIDQETKARFFLNQPIKVSLTMMLFFCLDGEFVCKDDVQVYTVKKNDVILKKSGSFGEVLSISPDMKSIVIIMNEKFYHPLFNSFDFSVLNKELISNPICTLTNEYMEECVTLYKKLKERLSSHKDDYLQEEIIKGYLHTLVFIVCSQYRAISRLTNEQGKPLKQNMSRQQDLFNQFMAELQENYERERNIAFYADKLCVTPRYLSRVIYDASGHFANEHIDLFVITEAKQLLRSKKYSILQVSEMLNFSNPSLFTRYFKRLTGYTPREYQTL